MKSQACSVSGFQATVDDGRGHSVVIDLPEKAGGMDGGPTALSLSVMALSGCMLTLFAFVAKKARFAYTHITVDVDARKGEETIEAVRVVVCVWTDASLEKVQDIFAKAMKICPVGILYEKAGVDMVIDTMVKPASDTCWQGG